MAKLYKTEFNSIKEIVKVVWMSYKDKLSFTVVITNSLFSKISVAFCESLTSKEVSRYSISFDCIYKILIFSLINLSKVSLSPL